MWNFYIIYFHFSIYHDEAPIPANYNGFAGPTITKSVIEEPNPALIIASLKATGLVETLSKPRKFPTLDSNNDAYAQISYDTLADLLRSDNVDQLEAILMRHGLPTVILSQDISKDHKWKTKQIAHFISKMIKHHKIF